MIWGSLSHDMVNLRIIGQSTNNVSGHIHLQVVQCLFIYFESFTQFASKKEHWERQQQQAGLGNSYDKAYIKNRAQPQQQ